MAWIEPITTWQVDDRYNYEDLNRVESNCDEILSIIQSIYGSVPVTEPSVTDRDNTNIEFADSLNRIEETIEAIKDFLYEPSGWIPAKTTWASNYAFSYIDANRLETNVLLLYNLISGAEGTIRKCGDFTCGNDFDEL